MALSQYAKAEVEKAESVVRNAIALRDAALSRCDILAALDQEVMPVSNTITIGAKVYVVDADATECAYRKHPLGYLNLAIVIAPNVGRWIKIRISKGRNLSFTFTREDEFIYMLKDDAPSFRYMKKDRSPPVTAIDIGQECYLDLPDLVRGYLYKRNGISLDYIPLGDINNQNLPRFIGTVLASGTICEIIDRIYINGNFGLNDVINGPDTAIQNRHRCIPTEDIFVNRN